eukprot:scaffold96_cov302-Prasinococcus_capsulatus_cf.AAC.1
MERRHGGRAALHGAALAGAALVRRRAAHGGARGRPRAPPHARREDRPAAERRRAHAQRRPPWCVRARAPSMHPSIHPSICPCRPRACTTATTTDTRTEPRPHQSASGARCSASGAAS